MRLSLIVFLCCMSSFVEAKGMSPDRTFFSITRAAASQDEPISQMLMGFFCELGYGVPQDFGEAAVWYSRAIRNGNELALRRLGILTFFGIGVAKDEELGILLTLLGPHDDLLPNITSDEQLIIKALRNIWKKIQSEHCIELNPTQNLSRLRKNWATWQSDISITLISDRPDLADANEVIYGPGTGDWNTGISRYEYEQIEKSYQNLIAQINKFHDWANEKKVKDLQAQIERMQAESEKLKNTALKEFLFAIGNALATGGLLLEVPSLALIEGFRAVEGFKETAERYIQALDIEKDAQKLLDIERSLERARSFGGRE